MESRLDFITANYHVLMNIDIDGINNKEDMKNEIERSYNLFMKYRDSQRELHKNYPIHVAKIGKCDYTKEQVIMILDILRDLISEQFYDKKMIKNFQN